MEEAAKADRIIVMNKGEVYREGTPEEIFSMDEELIQLGLDIPFSSENEQCFRQKGIELIEALFIGRRVGERAMDISLQTCRVSLSSKYSF